MDPQLWDRIQQIYHLTLPISESERWRFVDNACGSDPFLVREVTSLLDADKSTGEFLESPVFELGLRIITSNTPNNGEDSDTSLADTFIGSTIDGHYLVEKELGRGAMGAVYLARDLTLYNRPIVIKTLLPASLKNAYVLKKFKQEVEALSRIDHPGVVSVLGAGELADGKLYIGMQYVNGVTLRSQILSEGMNFERAGSILKQVGAALDDVHEKGIFHRDLKPENIMLQTLTGGAELVKIVDFGIAKVKDSVVAPSTVNEAPVGTVLYMSPEQLRGEKVATVSDIYSMAVIAYEMVTGRRPFNPASAPQLLEMHRAGVRVRPIDLRSNVSTEAQAIILRALSFQPKDRYQTASEFGNALARALSDEQESAKSDQSAKRSPTEPSKVNSWRSNLTSTRARIVSISLLLVVGFAALIGLYISRAHKQASGSALRPQRSFSYWLTVQRMRDGRLYQDPFQSLGQETFENGHKFRLHVSSPDSGYLYVVNEGPPEEDGTSLTMVYPTPSIKNAFVSKQPVQTNWNTFGGPPGTENLWIVWSISPVSELESAKTEAFDSRKGALTDANSIRAVREFLTKYAEPKPESTQDTTALQTHIRGVGDVVVKLAQLEHR